MEKLFYNCLKIFPAVWQPSLATAIIVSRIYAVLKKAAPRCEWPGIPSNAAQPAAKDFCRPSYG